MSITSDLRTYADTALEQGKQVVGQAQAQLTDVTGTANEFVGKLTATAQKNVSGLQKNVAGLSDKATATVADLRTQAEKTLNLDAIVHAVEPYLAQAREAAAGVTDRAESVLSTVTDDPRVAKVVATVEQYAGLVVETVQQRVVAPVRTLARRGAPAQKPATASAPKPAATRPATTKSAAKAPAKKATTARTSAAKKAATPAE